MVTPGYLRYVWRGGSRASRFELVGSAIRFVATYPVSVLLVLSIPVGVILACVAHRFSIVEGLAGDVGYEDLDAKQDDKPPA